MTLLLRIKDPQHFRKRKTGKPVRTINLDAEPCPVVMATGLRSVTCDKYHLEEDGRTFVPDPEKPAYRVPSMAEIAAIKPNGLKVISTFAGCGGSSLGYRMAGFKVLWASEFVDRARLDYEANAAPGTIVDGRDIRQVNPLEVLKTVGLEVGELDVLDGSPPCASFSTAGKREKHWGKEKKYSDKVQRTDDLFFEYVRFVEAMRPRVFVAENVSGLVKGTAKGYFIEILKAMKACGYRVEARLVDAQWLGVPQQRQRIMFVGVREDLGLDPAFPAPFPYRYSVRDALPWIGGVRFDTGGAKQAKEKDRPVGEPCPAITVGHANHTHFKIEDETDISRFAIGKEADRLSPGQQSDKYFSLVRAPLDGPSPTVTAQGGGHASGNSIASVIHPTEKRKFSIAELKRICAFPDDFALGGSYANQWERCGRAVPPLMMKAIAEAIRDGIFTPRKPVRTVKAPDVRMLLLDALKPIKPKRVALLLSGGIDSLSCLFALQELGKRVIAYSFALDGRQSSDLELARKNAKEFGVEFHEVRLPLQDLERDLRELAVLGAVKKTDFECAWPVVRALREIDEDDIVSGHGADGHFCISKKGMVHWRNRIDEFRKNLFANPGYAQKPILSREASRLGKQIWMPYLDRRVIKAFIGTTWAEVNKPKQKQTILDAWPANFARVLVRPHINLQLGDSGIAELFRAEIGKGRSPVGAYNAIARAFGPGDAART